MNVINGIANFTHDGQPLALTLGFFDGVHRGHQQLLARLRDVAREMRARSAVLTFDSHPFRIVCPDRLPPMIMTLTRRIELIRELGIDTVIVQPFDEALCAVSARVFLHDILRKKLRADAIVFGYDTHFGRNREGDHELLRTSAAQEGYRFVEVPPMTINGEVVSSTAIRRAIQQGDFARAALLLGRPWTLWAHVVEGCGVGRTLGFPTANLDVGYLVLPAPGIYASYVHLHGAMYRGVMYVGTRPTLSTSQRVACEVYIMDFSGDLYDEWLHVEPVHFIRSDHMFPSTEALREQIARDVAQAAALLPFPREAHAPRG